MQHYFDLYLKSGDLRSTRDAMGKAWRIAHGCANAVQTQMAVAFPHYVEGRSLGDVLRVFTPSEEKADALARHIGDAHCTLIDDMSLTECASQAPITMAFFMERMPSNLPERLSGDKGWVKHRDELRQRALQRQREYPFAPMQSSTGHQFLLKVRREIVQSQAHNGVPNAYGLSRKTQVIALPMVI